VNELYELANEKPCSKMHYTLIIDRFNCALDTVRHQRKAFNIPGGQADWEKFREHGNIIQRLKEEWCEKFDHLYHNLPEE